MAKRVTIFESQPWFCDRSPMIDDITAGSDDDQAGAAPGIRALNRLQVGHEFHMLGDVLPTSSTKFNDSLGLVSIHALTVWRSPRSTGIGAVLAEDIAGERCVP